MIKVMLISQFMFFCLFGAAFGFTITKVRHQTEDSIMAQIPEEAYNHLSLDLLLKVPVGK